MKATDITAIIADARFLRLFLRLMTYSNLSSPQAKTAQARAPAEIDNKQYVAPPLRSPGSHLLQLAHLLAPQTRSLGRSQHGRAETINGLGLRVVHIKQSQHPCINHQFADLLCQMYDLNLSPVFVHGKPG